MQRKLMLIGLWLPLAAFAQTTTTTTRTETRSLAPFGLGSTETARITVVNLAAASASGTAATCIGTISFLSSTGAVIGAATTFTIGSSATATASLPFGSAGISGNRGELRAVISLTRTSGTPCELAASLATFDTSSGATHLYVAEAFPEAGNGRF